MQLQSETPLQAGKHKIEKPPPSIHKSLYFM